MTKTTLVALAFVVLTGAASAGTATPTTTTIKPIVVPVLPAPVTSPKPIVVPVLPAPATAPKPIVVPAPAPPKPVILVPVAISPIKK